MGYNSVQAATNGIEFAKDPDFAKAAAAAGLRYAYLQFDGIGNAANSHRAVGNLFDVKLQAIEHLHSAGVDIVPVITIINGVNNEQVGRVIDFALANPKKINFLSFQPVSFTGRDEEITVERRTAQRYTLSHLAHDVQGQTGIGVPTRDWFPIHSWARSPTGPTSSTGRIGLGPAELRLPSQLRHRHGVMVDKETKESVPVTAFLDAGRLSKDLARVNDAARGRGLTVLGMALSLMRNYDPFKAPTHFKLSDLMKKFDKTFGATGRDYGKVSGDRTKVDIDKRRSDRWNFLFIAGCGSRICSTTTSDAPSAASSRTPTQEGEISFCAYNTGIGWRNIIEKMHMTATLTKWYEEKGRHEIFAGGKAVGLASTDHHLVLDEAAVAAGLQTDLDEKGIAKTAREEKLRARAEQRRQADEEQRMAALYRQHVLGEAAPEPVVQIQGLGKSSTKTSEPVTSA